MNIPLHKSRTVSAILILVLLFTMLPAGIFSATEEQQVTHYRLDTGFIALWKNSAGAWQNGWQPGDTSVSTSYNFTIPTGAKDVKVYAYNGSNFTFENDNTHHWNRTAAMENYGDKSEFERLYYNYRTIPLKVSHSHAGSTGDLRVTYDVGFQNGKGYNVKEELLKGESGKSFLINLLGSPNSETLARIEEASSFSSNVEGYWYFMPIVIEYTVMEQVKDLTGDTFKAILQLPSTARVGETYKAVDISEIGADTTVKTGELNMREVGKSTWNPVVTWPGRGKGQNTGGSKNEKQNTPGEYEYRLLVTATDGRTDTDIKKIRILAADEEEPAIPEEEADPDISLTAILSMPNTVYEGHTVTASDQSTYVINGKNYSSDAAYNEHGARHSFTPSREANAKTETNYKNIYADAGITWPIVGSYDVALRISLKGLSDTDTKPIEVLKTPAIIDNLGGAQKENRKQTLAANIATNPLYPVKTAYMILTEKTSGESVRLDMGGKLQNSDNIKTRAIETKEGSDAYFTKLEFPFLTKYGETREFTYTIFAEDTRGQTAEVTRDFTVVPDLPPVPEVLLPTVFYREKGTNVAKITATDLSHSAESDPGDVLERTWYVSYPGTGGTSGFVPAKEVAGYEEPSFEADKEIVFDKTGVGPVEVKIHLKDVWTDETLEEYITGDDYLTADSEVYKTLVDNIAPVVSLSAKPTKSADILLLAAGNAEYNALLARKNEIDGGLIEKGIDAHMSIEKLPRSPNGVYSDFQSTMNLTGNTLLSSLFTVDKDTFYAVTGTLDTTDMSRLVAPYRITAYDAYSGAVRWSVGAPAALAESIGTIKARDEQYMNTGSSGDRNLIVGSDEEGRYLYIIVAPKNPASAVASKTYIFDKQTGAHVRTFDAAFGSYSRVFNNNIYSLQADGIYRYKPSGASERLFTGQISGAASLFAGKMRFFTQISPYAYIGDFDPVTEKTTLTRLTGIAFGANNTSVGADQTGAMIVRTTQTSGYNTTTYTSMFFDKTGRLLLSMPGSVVPIKDGEGKLTHAAYASSNWNQALTVYDLYTGKNLSRSIQSTNESGMPTFVLYGFDRGNGAVDVQIGKYSNDLGPGWGDSYSYTPGVAGLCAVNMRTDTINFTRQSSYLGCNDGRAEYAFSSESLYAVGWTYNSFAAPPPADDTRLKVDVIPRTEDQILAKATASLMTNDVREIKEVLVVEDGSSKFSIGGARFKSALGAASAVKLSDSGASSLVNSIVQSISSSELAAQKTAVVKKTAGAAQGSISRSFVLDTQRTYYYEYEATGDAKGGVSFSASTVSEKLAANTGNLYVQKTHFDGIGIGPPSGFFTGATKGWVGSTSFTVPKGAYGVLSFDYNLFCAASDAGNFARIAVDGTTVLNIGRAYRPGGMSAGWYANSASGAYVHKVLLGEGTHTLEGSARAYYAGVSGEPSYASVGNLKFELLGSAPPEASKQSVKEEDAGGGFTRYTGSFETPSPVISYSPHPVSVYSGAVQGSPFFAGEEEGGGISVYIPSLARYTFLPYYHRVSFNIPAGLRIFDHHMTVQYNDNAGTAVPLQTTAGDFTYESATNKTYFTDYLISYASSAEAWTQSEKFFFDSTGRSTYTENETYTGTKISYSFTADTSKIRNFSLYYLENGLKVYLTRDSLESASEAAAWTTVNAALAVVDEKPTSEEKEKGALIYKKGQLVAYSIAYTDYENDPSKEEFWRYTHTPFNDGEHPDAGTIMSRTGEALKVTDKVLPKSIDRFYIDGKYVVEHWQRDNTDRTNAGNGAVNYDEFNKFSNTESLTFYIEGGGEAPWVTGIKTNPDPVTEGARYKLDIGVDDIDKDDLTVLTEVYFKGKEVYRHYRENLKADEAGNYPRVITGLAPEAEVGVYTVVATVWDEDGTGLGNHSFTVIAEGRIKGAVHHTDQWDDNRKSYNTKLFGEAYNQISVFETYKAQKAPRKRGTNVFWSGERFMLEAAVGGNPTKVTCRIDGYPSYSVNMANTGRKNADGDAIYTGSIWNEDMINKWGRDAPILLKFIFTSFYDGDITKTHEESVIVDMHEDYWRLHRYF